MDPNLTANLHEREWAGAGGRTLPERSFLLPRWLLLEERIWDLLGCFDRGQMFVSSLSLLSAITWPIGERCLRSMVAFARI